MPNLYNLQFTDIELDTIANAMEDYMQYDDEKLNTESLFGGYLQQIELIQLIIKLMKHLKIKELDTQIQELSKMSPVNCTIIKS